MAKTRSAAKPESEENSDGLEIISIGSLYKGPWDKKYWSSSRGKDRYPYPVGYQATRAHNGTTYKMEIHEGVSGPRFVITSADGCSCSGKTPDIALEELQKKIYPRTKIWHGKRLSSMMDGLELFGFKNPFVQRLLRELVSDLNGVAEQSLNLCDEISEIRHDDCSQSVGTHPDLLLCLRRPHVTGKRSKRSDNKNVNIHGGTSLKRPRPQEFTCSSIASKFKTEGCLNLGSSITHDVSAKEKETHNQTGASASMHLVSSAGESADFFSLKNVLLLNQIDISDDQKGRAVHAERTSGIADSTNVKAVEIIDSFSKEEEPLHRSQDAELKMTREGNKPLASIYEESESCFDIDLCAADTVDYGQENNYDSMPSNLDKDAFSKGAHQIISGDVLTSEHQEEVVISNSNPSFEESEFDLGGQDVAKSMMTVLLPQAIPLLKKDSMKKKLTINPSGILPSMVNSSEDNKIGNFLDAASSGGKKTMHMTKTDLSSIVPSSQNAKFVIADSFEPSQSEDAIVGRLEKIHIPNTDLISVLPSSQNAKFVIADSFEPSQSEDAFVGRDERMQIPNSDLISVLPSSQNAKFVADSFEPSQSEDAIVGREQSMPMPNSNLISVLPSSQNAKFVIADSFEPSQCEDHKSDQAILPCDIAEADRADFHKETCSPGSSEQHTCGALPNESSTCHADINLTKNNFCHVSELASEKSPQDVDVCIPDSVLDHNDACTDLEENSVPIGLNSLEKDQNGANDFTGDISEAPKKTEDEVVGDTGNTETTSLPSVQVPNIVYKRRKIRNAAALTERNPFEGKTKSDNHGEPATSELHTAKGPLPASETIQMNTSDNELCDPELLQARDKVQYDDLQRDNSITNFHIKQNLTITENMPFLCATDESILCPDDISVSHVETPPVRSDVLGGYGKLAELNSPISCWTPNSNSCEENCFSKEAQVVSEPNPHRNEDLDGNESSIIKFVGCYTHPMPVSSLLLSRRENEILIFVFCGRAVDQERTLFTFKVGVKEPNMGCPSFIAYTTLLLPEPKHNSIREVAMVERSGVQLTPDGQYIVLLDSIKTPYCRERKIGCYCSSCTSICSEENALKIVQVEHGYVSVVATLKSVEVLHCILVCEPSQLVSVGESGRLQVWVMNSTWREKIEDFIIPVNDYTSPGIVELKRVPKCAHLVVGYDGVGKFSLWDISKRNCILSFPASTNPIIQFLPVSLFNCQTNSPGFRYASVDEQVDQLLGATSLWFSECKETCSLLPSEEGDIAMWLLVSTASEVESSENCISGDCQINTAESWRLALLAKNNMIFGSPLNIRTTGVGVLGGHGIISTCDGQVHIWELSKGFKLGTLHHFQDGNVTCIATDDSNGGAFGVAGGEGKLLVYLHHNNQ